MHKSKIIGLLFVIGFSVLSVGCATVQAWSSDACEAVLGGSKAGSLCVELEKLYGDAEAAETTETE